MILFAILLAIGIWGLTVYTQNYERNSLFNEVRDSMINHGKNVQIYENSNIHMKKLDWLHKRYKTFSRC